MILKNIIIIYWSINIDLNIMTGKELVGFYILCSATVARGKRRSFGESRDWTEAWKVQITFF